MTDALALIDAPAPATPRRLHPGTIALRIAASLPSTLLGIPAFLAIAGGRNLGLVALGVLALLAIAAVATWLGWRAFTYAIDEDELVIADGVLGRRRRSIPRTRIQDVGIERKPLHRLFGLATVRIETGGADANEGVLDSVSVAEAERIRDLLRGSRSASAPADEAIAAPAPEHAVFAMSTRRVLLMGLFRFSLVWLAGIFAALQMTDDLIDVDGETIMRWLGATERELRTGGGALLAVAALLPVAALLGVVTGLGRTVLTEWGFRLTLDEGRLRRKRGLLTRTEVVVAIRRVQLALVERGLVSGRLGWAGLKVQTLGGSDDRAGRQELAPFARDPEVDSILDLLGLTLSHPKDLDEVARAHTIRSLLAWTVPPLLAILVASWWTPLALVALLALPIPAAAALFARSHHRYGLRDGTLQVTRGVLTRRAWVVPVDNVQAISVTRGWLQRRLGSATVRVGTAGARGSGRPDVVDATREEAGALALRVLAE